jgi:formylglycine-generating enzyme required for sulfatase activity
MGAVTDCSSGSTTTCAYGAAPPQPNVTVDAFALDACEVTVGRFRAFWRARAVDGGASIRAQPIRYPDAFGSTRQEIAWGTVAGREPEPQGSACNWSSSPSPRDAHPVNCVDWWTAQEFCVWDRGPETYGTSQNGRLPTEAEWEYATRGRAVPAEGLVSGRTYPWGEQVPQGSRTTSCDRAQWNSCAGEDGGGTRRVGRFAATGGFFDLAGNVWEWTADNYSAYTSSCVTRASSRNPLCNYSAAGTRAFRGGAWDGISDADLRSASRGSGTPAGQDYFFLGFRCAGTLAEAL